MVEMNKLVFLAAAIIPILLVPNVFAGGPRHDSDDRYSHIPGAGQCWVDGYDAGFAGKYDIDRAEYCEDKGDQYNASWIVGCHNAGYLPKECDDFRDNPVQIGSSYRLSHENTIWCWSSGYWDGLIPTFDKDKDSGCSEYGSLYDNGFMEGCIRADNQQNRTSCDRLTKD